MSMEDHFEQILWDHDSFWFIYTFHQLQHKKWSTELLHEAREKLTAWESKDLVDFMFAEELKSLSSIIPEVTYNDPV